MSNHLILLSSADTLAAAPATTGSGAATGSASAGGAATSTATGSGVPSSPAGAAAGTGTASTTGSGSASGGSSAAGVASSKATAAGAATSPSATAAGSASSSTTGAGAAASPTSQASATGTSTSTGSGSADGTGSATGSGSSSNTGAGAATSEASASGAADTTQPTSTGSGAATSSGSADGEASVTSSAWGAPLAPEPGAQIAASSTPAEPEGDSLTMATYATLTVPVKDILGDAYKATAASAWIEPSTKVLVVDGTELRLGGRRGKPDGSGNVVFEDLLTTDSADNDFGYVVVITYFPVGGEKPDPDVVSTAVFSLTANKNLAAIPEAWVDQAGYAPVSIAGQLSALGERIDALEDDDAADDTTVSQLASRVDSLEQGGLGGGGGALIVSAGGTINLDETLLPGTLVGYRFTGSATVEGIVLAAGSYVFERDTSSPSGWTYRNVAEGADLPVPDGGGGDPEEPVEVTPQEPVWNDSLRNYVIPNLTGVQYKKGGVNIAAGTYDTTSPTAAETVTITAVAKTGYVFPDGVATSWSHNYPLVTEWITSFTDALDSPVGAITARDGWTVYNPGGGADEIGIEGTGNMYLTGTTYMQAFNPVDATNHFVQCYYDLTSNNNDIEHLYLDLAFEGGTPQRFILDKQSSGARVQSWASGVATVTGLPLTGTLRAESDGTYIRAFHNGTMITEGPIDPSLLGSASPIKCRIFAKGAPVSGARFRIKDVVMGTKA